MNKIDLIIDALELCTWHDQQGYLTVQKALDAARELREIMQQALTVLKDWDALIKYQYGGTSEAMTAMQYAAWNTMDAISVLEAELAKPEQEPVAWLYHGHLHEIDPSDWAEYKVTPLYTSPPRKEWVGLTDEEIISSSKFFDYMTNEELIDAVRELETKLKEKNT